MNAAALKEETFFKFSEYNEKTSGRGEDWDLLFAIKKANYKISRINAFIKHCVAVEPEPENYY